MSASWYWPLLFKNRRNGARSFLSGDRWSAGSQGIRVVRYHYRSALSFRTISALFYAVLSITTPHCVSAQPSPDIPLDIVLALDNSGSMKQNDPDRVMGTVVSTFGARLPENARLAIVVFDKNAIVALPLSSVSAADFGENTKHALRSIDYRGKWTDIPGAVERSLYELREHGRPASHRVIVLFTDGFVDLGDPAKDRARADWLRSDLIVEARRESVMIFGIAFTEAADFELLQSVSQQTGGTHFRILNASEIPSVFEQVTERIRHLPAEQTPPAGPNRSSGQQQPGNGYSGRGGAIPLLWVVVGLAALLGASGSWLWWARASAPPVPATLQDCAQRVKVYSVDKRTFRIGRVRNKGLRRNDLVIPEKHVSRAHAEICFRKGEFYIRDHGSLHGTFVNGVKLKPGRIERLKNEDVLRFDAYEFIFGSVVAVAVGGASVLTELAPDPATYQSSPGMPILKRPSAAHAAAAGTTLDAVRPQEGKGGVLDAKSSKSTEECLGCDNVVRSADMRPFHGYRICPDCEATVLSLQSGQVQSFVRKLEIKRLRRLQTIGNL